MSGAELLVYGLVFFLGASAGSFINVVAYRLPAGLSLVSPPSRCPSCFTRLKPYDNVPVLGWLSLRGACRYCRQPISPRYPVVEFCVGVLFLLTFIWFGFSLNTVGYWLFLCWLMSLSLIDLDTMLLPNPLTQSGVVLGLLFHSGLGLITGGWGGLSQGLINSFGGAVIGLWMFDIIALVGLLLLRREAMGGGDAKLVAMIGAWLGWKLMLLSTFLACLVGTVIGGGGMLLGHLGRWKHIPFGPYLSLGAAISLFWGPSILAWYWQWAGF